MTPRRTRNRAARACLALALAAATLATAPAARAATLASGYLWSENATSMVCFLWNVSASPVNVQSVGIYNSGGTNVTFYDACTGQPLQPGKRCGFQAVNVAQAAGRAQIDVARNRVRGTCQLSRDGNLIVEATEMQ